ncbi:MAG: hypothetical protein U9Q92_04875, partial [archaeon]|nr:hypothetical protein [archaeon]
RNMEAMKVKEDGCVFPHTHEPAPTPETEILVKITSPIEGSTLMPRTTEYTITGTVNIPDNMTANLRLIGFANTSNYWDEGVLWPMWSGRILSHWSYTACVAGCPITGDTYETNVVGIVDKSYAEYVTEKIKDNGPFEIETGSIPFLAQSKAVTVHRPCGCGQIP